MTRPRLWMVACKGPSLLSYPGEWRTFCRCGGRTAGVPWVVDSARRA